MRTFATILIGLLVVLALLQIYKMTRGLTREQKIDYLNSTGVGIGTWVKMNNEELDVMYLFVKQTLSNVEPSDELKNRASLINKKYQMIIS